MRRRHGIALAGLISFGAIVAYFIHATILATQGPSALPGRAAIVPDVGKTDATKTASAANATSHPARHATTTSAPSPLPPPGTPLGKIYAELASRARSGDNGAAMRLVYDLQRCKHRDVMSSTAYIVANRHRTEASATTADQANMENRYLEKNLDYLDKMDLFCAGVAPNQIDQRGEWLQMAALNGDAEAMVCYAMAPYDFGPKPMTDAWFDWAEQWRVNAPQFAARAFAAGQADVIALLQDAYSAGSQLPNLRVTGFQFSQLESPDPMLAYAYALLYERVVPESALANARRIAQDAQASLSQDQIAQAQAFADAAWPRFMTQAGQHDNILPCFEYIYGASKQ